jgi:hypothetical protein
MGVGPPESACGIIDVSAIAGGDGLATAGVCIIVIDDASVCGT